MSEVKTGYMEGTPIFESAHRKYLRQTDAHTVHPTNRNPHHTERAQKQRTENAGVRGPCGSAWEAEAQPLPGGLNAGGNVERSVSAKMSGR